MQRYLKKLNKKGELTNDMYDKIRPKSAKLARVHGLPNIHKVFENIPLFRPITDATGTTHKFNYFPYTSWNILVRENSTSISERDNTLRSLWKYERMYP